MVSLVDNDRQWFKSHHGLDAKETPRNVAFCAHAINTPNKPFIVEDARLDKRFFDNPLVKNDPRVVFYAGIPLLSDNNLPLGTLCVVDQETHKLTENQVESLVSLSKQVMSLNESKKNQTST